MKSEACTLWCEKRGWIPVDGTAGRSIDSPPIKGQVSPLGKSLPGLRNPFRGGEKRREVTPGNKDKTTQHLERETTSNEGHAKNFNMASAMRVREEEDITDGNILIPAPKLQRREGKRKATAIGNLRSEIADRENPKRGGTRSATAANTSAAGNDDAIPKAAVPSRASAKGAPATKGPQARRHKTSGLRPSVRPKLEDDKYKTKLGADGDVAENPMRTRANNLYLLGISKENSELITANGASHLARFLEAKKTNIQTEDVKKQPVKVEEKASVTVAGPRISQAGGNNGMRELEEFLSAR